MPATESGLQRSAGTMTVAAQSPAAHSRFAAIVLSQAMIVTPSDGRGGLRLNVRVSPACKASPAWIVFPVLASTHGPATDSTYATSGGAAVATIAPPRRTAASHPCN